MKFYQKYDVKVPMRDGIKLSCDIRMPDQSGSYPVILLRTPYNKQLNPDSPAVHNMLHLLEKGYCTIHMDVRGKYESEGIPAVIQFDQEGRDGADAIKWIKEQPWCNGKIATTGASYCGFVQMTAAAEQPDGLVTITPGVFGNDGFSNTARKDGVPQLPLLIWGICNASGRVSKVPLVDWQSVMMSVPLMEIANKCGVESQAIKDWLLHNTDGDFWHRKGDKQILDKINVPVLLTGGWYDVYSTSMLETFQLLTRRKEMHGKVKVVFGPWAHSLGSREVGELDFGIDAEVDINWLNTEWINIWAKGEGNPDEWPNVRIFMMGENRWIESDCWPLENTVPTDMFFTSDSGANGSGGDGRLEFLKSAGSDLDYFDYDPVTPVMSVGGNILSAGGALKSGPCNQAHEEVREDMLIYTSEELTETFRIAGQPVMEVYVESTAPDTDIIVRLCDVYPDGRSINLCCGIYRTRYREGFDKEVMMTPGHVYKLNIPLDITANAFLPKHHIRLEISSGSFPLFARNHQTGGDNVTETEFAAARHTIHHSAQYPSRLILPVVKTGVN